MKKKVLFLSPLPPPYYGSAMSSQMCLEILQKFNKFEVKNIKLNYSKEINDVGQLNLSKVKGFFIVKKQIKKLLKEFQPEIIYFVPATSGLGLIRDSYFVKQIKKLTNRKIIFHIRSRITDESWDKNKKRFIEMLKGEKSPSTGELNNSSPFKVMIKFPSTLRSPAEARASVVSVAWPTLTAANCGLSAAFTD